MKATLVLMALVISIAGCNALKKLGPANCVALVAAAHQAADEITEVANEEKVEKEKTYSEAAARVVSAGCMFIPPEDLPAE